MVFRHPLSVYVNWLCYFVFHCHYGTDSQKAKFIMWCHTIWWFPIENPCKYTGFIFSLWVGDGDVMELCVSCLASFPDHRILKSRCCLLVLLVVWYYLRPFIAIQNVLCRISKNRPNLLNVLLFWNFSFSYGLMCTVSQCKDLLVRITHGSIFQANYGDPVEFQLLCGHQSWENIIQWCSCYLWPG